MTGYGAVFRRFLSFYGRLRRCILGPGNRREVNADIKWIKKLSNHFNDEQATVECMHIHFSIHNTYSTCYEISYKKKKTDDHYFFSLSQNTSISRQQLIPQESEKSRICLELLNRFSKFSFAGVRVESVTMISLFFYQLFSLNMMLLDWMKRINLQCAYDDYWK
jgi:hypothetical protein